MFLCNTQGNSEKEEYYFKTSEEEKENVDVKF